MRLGLLAVFPVPIVGVGDGCDRRQTKMLEEESLAELFKAIEKKTGAYSRDHLTHAENCIEHMSQCAQEIRKRLQEWNEKFPYLASWRLIKEILGE